MDGETVVYFGDYKTIKTRSKSNDTATYRAPLQNADDAAKWLLEYEKKTRTKYIVYKTQPGVERSLFRKKWKCQHSSLNKKTKAEAGCKNRFTGRNAECPAKLSIKIKKVNKSTKQNDPYLKLNPPLQAVISVDVKHSHNLECPVALRLLRPTAETKAAFLSMFDSGMSPSETRQFHKSKLLLQENGIELIADGSINPPERAVRMWHQEWKQTRFGPQVGPLKKIKEQTPDDYHTDQLPSGKIGGPLNGVQTAKLWCSCLEGKQAAVCEHQVLVHETFGDLFPNTPSTTSKDRYELAKLAPVTLADTREAAAAENSENNAANHERDDQDSLLSRLTVEDSSLDNELVGLQEQEDFSREMIRVFDLVKGTAVFKRHCGKITQKLKNIKTVDEAVEAFLLFRASTNSSTGTSRTRPGGYTEVQPTSVSRRREGTTRGSKRLAAGRPQKSEPQCKQARVRPHKLSLRVEQNVPHTK